ncbi:MAG: hypothetical protein OHK0022_33750 [Roseiflexaceae bacterium]
MRCHHIALVLVAVTLLGGCGVAERPAGLEQAAPTELAAYPLAAVAEQFPSETSQPTPNLPESAQTATALAAEPWLANPTWQANLAFQTEQAKRRERREQTARAMGPPPTQVIGTPDLRPTQVPFNSEKLPGGGYLIYNYSYPSSHPRYTSAWFLDLPDQSQVRVKVGGYIFQIDNPGVKPVQPDLGVLSVGVYLYEPTKKGESIVKGDPRNNFVELPVRDGMARIVDALVTEDRITVLLRTDGLAYTYEVNSRTLAPAEPPAVDPGGPYTVRAGEFVGLKAQGFSPAGMLFDYAWDLDGDGTFETKGQQVGFSAKELAAPQQRTVRVQATAKSGLSTIAEATVTVID